MTEPLRTRSSNWIAFAALGGLLLVYLFVLRPLARDHGGRLHPAIGSKLGFLSLKPLTGDGRPVELADLQGKVVLVNFWGTWCPPCRLEFPHIVSLFEKLRSQSDFQLLSVSCGSEGHEDEAELREATEAYLKQRKADLPTYIDPDYGTRMAVMTAMGSSNFAYPTTLILDRKGIIRGFWEGAAPGEAEMQAMEDDMHELIEELLAESDQPSKM